MTKRTHMASTTHSEYLKLALAHLALSRAPSPKMAMASQVTQMSAIAQV